MSLLTRDEVIRTRQNELVNEVFTIEEKIKELSEEIERLTILKEQRMMEHQLLEEVGERSILEELSRTSGKKTNRLSFEDCLVQMYDKVGRPLRMKDLIAELEKFGYVWSDYHKAYAYITSTPIVKSAGVRGYYQVVQTRGW